jgi:hypothetical protein
MRHISTWSEAAGSLLELALIADKAQEPPPDACTAHKLLLLPLLLLLPPLLLLGDFALRALAFVCNRLAFAGAASSCRRNNSHWCWPALSTWLLLLLLLLLCMLYPAAASLPTTALSSSCNCRCSAPAGMSC